MWTVTGSWQIECPRLAEQWPDGGSNEYTLDIHETTDRQGNRQMWAYFDFHAVTGVMRFVSPSALGQVSHDHVSALRQNDDVVGNEDEDEDEDGNEDEDEDEEDLYADDDSNHSDNGYSSAEFALTSTEAPSATNSAWHYRWRGEETGEGEIQLGSDSQLESIRFGGPGGTTMEGSMHVPFEGLVEFTGFKVKSLPHRASPYGIADEWASRNETTYEHARVGRWR